MADARNRTLHDLRAFKSFMEKSSLKTSLGTARSNSSEDTLNGLSEEELYYFNIYQEFIASANIHPVKMKSLLDNIFEKYDNFIPGFENGVQSEVNLNLDLFWLDKMSPRDSTYRSGFIEQLTTVGFIGPLEKCVIRYQTQLA